MKRRALRRRRIRRSKDAPLSGAFDLQEERRAGELRSRTASASDRVAYDIVQGLYEGRFVPGQRLVESDLTALYGVSRGSVRDALKRLSSEGLVIIHPNKGAQIRQLSRKDMRDVMALFEQLTGLSARLCAERIDDPSVADAVRRHYDNLLASVGRSDIGDFVRARSRFFRLLIDLSNNGELQRVMPSLHLHLIRVQTKGRALEQEIERPEDYRRIGEAILSGHPLWAEIAARRHVRRLANLIESLPHNEFAQSAALAG